MVAVTSARIRIWLALYGKELQAAGASPEQTVALCRWKLSDKVDREPWSRMMPLFANCCETDTSEIP